MERVHHQLALERLFITSGVGGRRREGPDRCDAALPLPAASRMALMARPASKPFNVRFPHFRPGDLLCSRCPNTAYLLATPAALIRNFIPHFSMFAFRPIRLESSVERLYARISLGQLTLQTPRKFIISIIRFCIIVKRELYRFESNAEDEEERFFDNLQSRPIVTTDAG